MSEHAPTPGGPDYLELSLDRFLELVASDESAPGGGSVAAVVIALAAGLSCMAARLSGDHLEDAAELVERSERLRLRAAPLAQADAEAYGRVMSAIRTRDEKSVESALSDAADVPLEIAEIGAEVVEISTRLAENGNPNLKGDAITAAMLVRAGVLAAIRLVEINLSAGASAVRSDDERLRRANELARSVVNADRPVEGA